MKKNKEDNSKGSVDQYPTLRSWQKQGKLARARIESARIESARIEFESIADTALQADQCALSELATTLSTLLELADCVYEPSADGNDQFQMIFDFVQQNTTAVFDVLDGKTDSDKLLAEAINQAQQNWGEHLALIANPDPGVDHFGDEPGLVADGIEEDAEFVENPPTKQQIDAMLAALGSSNKNADSGKHTKPTAKPGSAEKLKAAKSSSSKSNSVDVFATQNQSRLPDLPPELDLSSDILADAELREAYLDDANRCLAAMEHVVLSTEGTDNIEECVAEFCRQLHTVKGASASVGLANLAHYLHGVEEWLDANDSNQNGPIDIQLLLDAVDSVRGQIELVQNGGNDKSKSDSQNPEKAAASSNRRTEISITDSGSDQDGASVRVRAAKLDKLMDMLAELIGLRNQRDNQVNQLNNSTEELFRCANRLRVFGDNAMDWVLGNSARKAESPESREPVQERAAINAIQEVTEDLAEIGRSVKNIYKPIVQENQTLSQFIRQFRQELIQLRRVPMTGLFQRLQRAARDAARVENKKIKIKIVGQQVGLEQSLQEQLYDPLLHLVRNSVGHGIEDEETRRKNGKYAAGLITLEAISTTNLLILNIIDDGKGLDFNALRSRGYERGLLSPDQTPTKRELANLIFHPGFSTRDKASEVAGRGIGMDVVAGAINKLQGRIEIDSQPGVGTTMKISIPLRTGIDHTMVFRSGGQLFALPMQSIDSAFARPSKENSTEPLVRSKDSDIQNIRLTKAFGLEAATSMQGQQLVLQHDKRGSRPDRSTDRIGLIVDEIVGPDEVVVRSLPRTLERHPFLSGLTLSGNGGVVLLLDAVRLADFYFDNSDLVEEFAVHENAQTNWDSCATRRALVVDDSLSARKALAKRLMRRGFAITEAGDGLEALEHVRNSKFDLLVTDLDMPRLSGLELLADLQRDESFDAAVIVVSNRTEEKIRVRAEQLGAVAFTHKPVSEEKLDQILDAAELAMGQLSAVSS